jgi:hydrogenase maturation protease
MIDEAARPRILIAGIGNIFLGDDAFGVAVVQRLGPQPASVRVVDFGIRGLDLAFALEDGYDLVILVDALSRSGPPGTLYVIEPDLSDLNVVDDVPMLEGHSIDPLTVLRLVKRRGCALPPIKIVGCEPAFFGTDDDPAMGLSPAVEAAVEEAVKVIQHLVAESLYFRSRSRLPGGT